MLLEFNKPQKLKIIVFLTECNSILQSQFLTLNTVEDIFKGYYDCSKPYILVQCIPFTYGKLQRRTISCLFIYLVINFYCHQMGSKCCCYDL